MSDNFHNDSNILEFRAREPALVLSTARDDEEPEIREFVAANGLAHVYLREQERLRPGIRAGGLLTTRDAGSKHLVAINFRTRLDETLRDLSPSENFLANEMGEYPEGGVWEEMAHSVVRIGDQRSGIGTMMEAARLMSHLNGGELCAPIWLVVASNERQIARLTHFGLSAARLIGLSAVGWLERARLVAGQQDPDLEPSDWVIPFLSSNESVVNVLRRGAAAMRRRDVRIDEPLSTFCNPELMDLTANYYETRQLPYQVGPWCNLVELGEKIRSV